MVLPKEGIFNLLSMKGYPCCHEEEFSVFDKDRLLQMRVVTGKEA